MKEKNKEVYGDNHFVKVTVIRHNSCYLTSKQSIAKLINCRLIGLYSVLESRAHPLRFIRHVFSKIVMNIIHYCERSVIKVLAIQSPHSSIVNLNSTLYLMMKHINHIQK
jgi:hypothetical protein